MTMWKIKRLIYRVKRVIEFIPIIWKGYDFDYHSSIELFKYQLKRTAEYLESDKAQTLEAKTNAAKIWTAVELMEKVYDEEYGTEYIDIIEKLYGKTHYEFVELDEKDENGDPYYTMKISNELAVDEQHQKEIDEVRHQMFLMGMDKQKRAHKLLWSYIEHNILKWWD
jgi:hypothetical protein